jgi:3-oxoacyl-[acyl-carrier protein] reductase
MAINARGPWLSARAAIPALREAGGGSIVITSSLSGIRARPFLSAYQMAKAAAAMLAKSLSAEVASDQIRVNAVCPVAADTPMLPQFVATRPDPAAAIQSMAVGIPLGRLATAEDIANAALFFASDDSAFITGVVMPVDGGTFA